METPDAGSIKINGKEISTLRGKELRDFRRKIGMIFQHFNLLSSRTVRDNIAFPLEIAGIPVQEREKRVDRLMELVGLSAHADHYPSELSGGQKQRVGLPGPWPMNRHCYYQMKQLPPWIRKVQKQPWSY